MRLFQTPADGGPAEKETSAAADPAAYIAALLTLYVDLPDTPLPASLSDQWLARAAFTMTACRYTRSKPRCCLGRYAA